MNGKKLLLKFREDKVLLSDSYSLSRDSIKHDPGRRINSGRVWKIYVIGFYDVELRIFATIIDYNFSDIEFSKDQNDLFKSIKVEQIDFKDVNTYKLLESSKPTYYKYEIPEVKEQKPKRANIKEKLDPFIPVKNERIKVVKNYSEEEENKKLLNKQSQIRVFFEIQIEDITFQNGYIEFKKFITEAKREIEFKISNINMKKGYDSIKSYIKKYLKLDKLNVVGQVTFTSSEVIDSIATSSDLDKINDSIIEPLKFKIIEDEFISFKSNDDKNNKIFTVDGLYRNEDREEVIPDILHLSEDELLNFIISAKKSKHHKHLNYLADKHLSSKMKLRFTLHPFSFVFLLENELDSFIVWETLNTKEATYMWRIKSKEKNILKEKVEEIGNIIGTIKDGRKRGYIKSKPDDFLRIQHDYSNFMKWKADLEMELSK